MKSDFAPLSVRLTNVAGTAVPAPNGCTVTVGLVAEAAPQVVQPTGGASSTVNVMLADPPARTAAPPAAGEACSDVMLGARLSATSAAFTGVLFPAASSAFTAT